MIVSIFLPSCNQDPIDLSQNHNLLISQRSVTTTPGSFSVTSDGILNFPTVPDFHQTVSYIVSDTSYAQLASFRSSFAINTINKKANIILDSLDNFLHFPSKVPALWPNYSQILNRFISSGDTVLTNKYGTWGDFINMQNLVLVGGYLYKKTKTKTMIITDRDRDKLDEAEELDESDPDNGIWISPRICTCDPTGSEYVFSQTEYNSGGNLRIESSQYFSNMTLVDILTGGARRVRPMCVIENNIRIREKDIGWNCERLDFDWNRQVNLTHDIQIALPNANIQSDGSWNSSTGWFNEDECNFKTTDEYKYPAYTTTSDVTEPMGYCLLARTFGQSVETISPVVNNSF